MRACFSFCWLIDCEGEAVGHFFDLSSFPFYLCEATTYDVIREESWGSRLVQRQGENEMG